MCFRLIVIHRVSVGTVEPDADQFYGPTQRIFWGLIIWGAVKLFGGRGKTELEKEVAYLKGRLDKIDPKPPAAP